MADSDSSSTATSLAPGFRFHPTDEELVSYYLKRKICGKPFRFDAISDIDIYKAEPWELPGRSKLKSRDLEWYFFSVLDKKYGNGSRTNRATLEGYWKTTGKDRPVHHRCRVVGMKKTLVYHRGRAPRGERSNWVMHEYRLTDEDLAKAGISLDGFVLCRVFQKSGSGPKNGEQYGAPFVEEEWEDDNMVVMVPGQLPAAEGFVADDIADQSLLVDLPIEIASAPQKILDSSGGDAEDSKSLSGTQKWPLVAAVGENQCYSGLSDDKQFFNLPSQPELDADTGKTQYSIDPNNIVSHNSTCIMPGQSLDVVDNSSQAIDSGPCGDGFFLEANDLSPATDNNPPNFSDTFDDLLGFADQEENIEQYFNFDTLEPIMGIDFNFADDALCNKEYLYNGAELMPQASQQLPTASSGNDASSSKPVAEVPESESELEYPFINRVLGNIPAPPAFAAEFPTKDLAARLNAASDTIRVTAGMVRIRNTTANGNGTRWSLSKDGKVNVVLSFNVPESVVGPVGLDHLSGMLSGKVASTVARGWFGFFFFLVLLLAISVKMGTCIYAK